MVASTERLCRYITRPAISEKRLSMTTSGQVRYQLKTPYRDGTTFVLFDLLDFIVRLVALIPKPRINLTSYHGVICKILQNLEQREAQKGSAGRIMVGALASVRAPSEELFCYG